MAEGKCPALLPYIMEDEQRATPRIEKPLHVDPGYRDIWVLVGLLILLAFIFLIFPGVFF